MRTIKYDKCALLSISFSFLQIPLQAVQSLFDILQRRGVGEAQKSFAAAAEIDAGGYTDFRFFRDPESFLVRVGKKFTAVGKHIKRAGGFDMNDKTHLRQARQHIAAALVVGSNHSLDVRFGFRQRRDSRPLNEAVGRDHEVLMNALHDGAEFFGKDQVAQPPAGHRVEFGKAVDDKGPVGKFQNGVRLVPIDQTVVNFIGNNIRRVKAGNVL